MHIFFVVRSIRHLGAEPVSCMDTGVTPPHRVCPYMLIKELATPQPDILDVQVDNLEDVSHTASVARSRNRRPTSIKFFSVSNQSHEEQVDEAADVTHTASVA